MTRRDDVTKLYGYSNTLQKAMKWMFIFNIIASLIVCLVKNSNITNIAILVQILVSILYILLAIVDNNFFWYNAEKTRRNTSIENGFGIEITECKTEKYYNNSFQKSSFKFAVNAFESILFSKTTAGRMVFIEAIKAVISIVIFIYACIVYKNYGVVLIICQTVFSAYFIESFITLIIYKSRLDKLYSDFYKELITIGVTNSSQMSLILAYAIEYETIKSHYKVRLSEREFKKHNDETSLKWEQICKKIKYEGR